MQKKQSSAGNNPALVDIVKKTTIGYPDQQSARTYILKITVLTALSVGAVEYADCVYPEG